MSGPRGVRKRGRVEERKELGPHRFPVNGLNKSPEPTAHTRSEKKLSSQKMFQVLYRTFVPLLPK